MKALNSLIKEENAWSSIVGSPLLDITTAAGRQQVADVIDSKLSPENLSCDGELSRANINARFAKLTRAAAELKSLDPAVQFYEF